MSSQLRAHNVMAPSSVATTPGPSWPPPKQSPITVITQSVAAVVTPMIRSPRFRKNGANNQHPKWITRKVFRFVAPFIFLRFAFSTRERAFQRAHGIFRLPASVTLKRSRDFRNGSCRPIQRPSGPLSVVSRCTRKPI